MRAFFIIFGFILGVMVVHADEIAGQQKQALVKMLEDFNPVLEGGDISPLAEAMPPRIYEKMASVLQLSVEELKRDFVARVQKQLDDDGLKNYHFNSETIAYHETKTGEFYALVSTTIETREGGGEFQTLALYDEGRWYLIQGGQKAVQNSALLEIYPFLADVTIPPARKFND